MSACASDLLRHRCKNNHRRDDRPSKERGQLLGRRDPFSDMHSASASVQIVIAGGAI